MDCCLPGSSCPWNFSGKNTGVGCHFPPPRDLPDPGTETTTPILAGGFFTTSSAWGAHVMRCRERKSGSPSRGCSLRRYFFFFKLSCRSGIKLTGGWLTFYWPYPLITANRLGRRSQLCEEGDISLRIQIVRESLIVRGEKRRQRASCLS